MNKFNGEGDSNKLGPCKCFKHSPVNNGMVRPVTAMCNILSNGFVIDKAPNIVSKGQGDGSALNVDVALGQWMKRCG